MPDQESFDTALPSSKPDKKAPSVTKAKAASASATKKADSQGDEAQVSPPVKTGAKRGRKPKEPAAAAVVDELDLSDIEADLAGEPAVVITATGEKVKPLRMKISKAKERALMKEFGLDETVLSEEDIAKRRQRLKALITLGKTRRYLTHGEISDHLPDKLVDAETVEGVDSRLNDRGLGV